MSDQKGGSDEKHVYDDIVELDNALPRWWLWTFYLTIAFSVPYFLYYVMGSGPSLVQEYEAERVIRDNAALVAKASKKALSEDDLLKLVAMPEKQKAGREVFVAKCASCHGAQAGGGIGPNLADEYWIHGGKLADIQRTIVNGVAEKGMPPWGSLLSDDEVVSIVSFIRSVRGSNPPNAKAPQGTKLQ